MCTYMGTPCKQCVGSDIVFILIEPVPCKGLPDISIVLVVADLLFC